MYRFVIDPGAYSAGQAVGLMACDSAVPSPMIVYADGSDKCIRPTTLHLAVEAGGVFLERFAQNANCCGRIIFRFKVYNATGLNGTKAFYLSRNFGGTTMTAMCTYSLSTGNWSAALGGTTGGSGTLGSEGGAINTFEFRYTPTTVSTYWGGVLKTSGTMSLSSNPVPWNQSFTLDVGDPVYGGKLNFYGFEWGEYPVDIFSNAATGLACDGAVMPGVTVHYYDTTTSAHYTATSSSSGAVDDSLIPAGTYRICGVDAYGNGFCTVKTLT